MNTIYSKYIQAIPCFHWVSTGTCPKGKWCTFLHDDRVGEYKPIDPYQNNAASWILENDKDFFFWWPPNRNHLPNYEVEVPKTITSVRKLKRIKNTRHVWDTFVRTITSFVSEPSPTQHEN